jgi:hypothetical protein
MGQPAERTRSHDFREEEVGDIDTYVLAKLPFDRFVVLADGVHYLPQLQQKVLSMTHELVRGHVGCEV